MLFAGRAWSHRAMSRAEPLRWVRPGLPACLALSSCGDKSGERAAPRAAPRGPAGERQLVPEGSWTRLAHPAAHVVVALDDDPGGATVEERRAAIRERGEHVLAGAPKRGVSIHHRFVDFPVFSATITAEGLAALGALPDVLVNGIDHLAGARSPSACARFMRPGPRHVRLHGEGRDGGGARLGGGHVAPDSGRASRRPAVLHPRGVPTQQHGPGQRGAGRRGARTSVAAIVASRGATGPAGFAPAAKLWPSASSTTPGPGFTSISGRAGVGLPEPLGQSRADRQHERRHQCALRGLLRLGHERSLDCRRMVRPQAQPSA